MPPSTAGREARRHFFKTRSENTTNRNAWRVFFARGLARSRRRRRTIESIHEPSCQTTARRHLSTGRGCGEDTWPCGPVHGVGGRREHLLLDGGGGLDFLGVIRRPNRRVRSGNEILLPIRF